MLKTITAVLAVLIFGSNPAKANPNPNPDPEQTVILQTTIPNARPQRKFVNPVKLTVRHFPLHRIFADDDEDDCLGVAQHAMHHRREFVLAPIAAEFDQPIADDIALRLWLIRQQALRKYQQCWG